MENNEESSPLLLLFNTILSAIFVKRQFHTISTVIAVSQRVSFNYE